MKTPNTILRWTTFLAVLINVVVSSSMERLGLGQPTVAQVTRRYDNLFVPAGYAFAIWGLIYASFVIYAIVQIMPRQKDKTLYDHLAAPVILINLLGLLWQIVFRYDLILLSVGIILIMLVSGILFFLRSQLGIWAQHYSKWLMVPSSIFLGWISVATIANISLWLESIGWDGAGISDASWAKVLLGITILLSLYISIRFRDYLYPAVVAWASYAIFVALQNREEAVAQTAMYVAITAIILTIIAAARNARIGLRHHRTKSLS